MGKEAGQFAHVQVFSLKYSPCDRCGMESVVGITGNEYDVGCIKDVFAQYVGTRAAVDEQETYSPSSCLMIDFRRPCCLSSLPA